MKKIFYVTLMTIMALAGFQARAESENGEREYVYQVQAGEDLPEVAEGTYMVIDFNASWCMPCRMFKPAFDRAAQEFDGKAVFVSVNVDACPDLAREFAVQSIPFVLVLHDGNEVARQLGATSYPEFKAFLERTLR